MRSVLRRCLLLVSFSALPAQQPDVPIPDAATLQRDFETALRDWSKLSPEVRAKQPRPEAVFAPKFALAAQAFAGKEAAVPYLAWLVSRGTGDVPKEAMTTLMDAHVESPGVRLAVARIVIRHKSHGGPSGNPELNKALAECVAAAEKASQAK